MIQRPNMDNLTNKQSISEGTLYKVLYVEGYAFPLYYGYYDERDRMNTFVDPMPIYPDFSKEPRYTKEGKPFVTMMDDACEHYTGVVNGNEECGECAWYQHGQELLGTCTCPRKRMTGQRKEVANDG